MSSIRKTKGNKLALLGTTALFAALCVPGAMAQDADEPVTTTTTAASEDDEAVLDTVQVQGIRGSLQSARNLKRDSDTFVDSITSSDVTALPDLSVAEALARVPGVVVQRFELGGSDGDFPSPEGSGNIVRGLQYVRSEFNGRDAFSANGGRALEWASIPPELIGAVDVFKNQSADMIEGGISGTVNLRTLEPFDKDGRVAVFVADGTYTDLADEWSPGFSAILGDRWDTEVGEFGLLGSFSTSELNSAIQGFQYGPLLSLPNPFPNANPDSRIALPGGFQARDVEFQRERDSYYLAGQWRSPSGDHELTVKATRVENMTQSDERTFEFFTDAESWANWEFLGSNSDSLRPFTSAGLPQCNGNGEAANGGNGICETLFPVDGGLFESGVVSNGLRDWLGTDGTLGTPFQSLAVYEERESVTQDLSANFKWRATDQLYLEFDAQYTDAEASLNRLWAGGNHFADYAFDFSDAENPSVNLFVTPEMQLQSWVPRGGSAGVPPTSLADPATAFLLYAADEFQDNTGDLVAFRGDAEYEFDNDGWFDSVKFGARFSEREQNNRSAGLNWAGIAPPWAGGYLPYANRQDADAFEVFDFADFQRGGVFQGNSTGVVFPSRDQLQDYDAFVSSLANEPLINSFINPDGNLQITDWVPLVQNGQVDYSRGVDGFVSEKTTNFYGMLNFGDEFDNGQALSGNVGLRYVKTETDGGGVLSYTGFPVPDLTDPDYTPASDPRTYLPELAAYLDQPDEAISIGSSYEYWLPSLNVKWELNDEMIIRFAASQGITRPNIADLNSSRNVRPIVGFVTDPNPAPGTRPGTIDIVPDSIRFDGGNPNLEPIEATNYDLSFEWYFGDDGQFSVSAFHKDIDNIIVFGVNNEGSATFDGYTIPTDYGGNVNLNSGTVQGVEFAYQQFYTDLPGLFGNLGIQANFTVIDSEATPLPAFEDADGDGVPDDFLTVYRYSIDELLGLSDLSGNLIGIYQDDRFEGRLAYNWRSDYFSSYRDFITGNPIIQEEIGYLDASFKWEITDNLQFRILGSNLLDTKNIASQQVDQAGQRFARSNFLGDRRFEVGFKYEF